MIVSGDLYLAVGAEPPIKLRNDFLQSPDRASIQQHLLHPDSVLNSYSASKSVNMSVLIYRRLPFLS